MSLFTKYLTLTKNENVQIFACPLLLSQNRVSGQPINLFVKHRSQTPFLISAAQKVSHRFFLLFDINLPGGLESADSRETALFDDVDVIVGLVLLHNTLILDGLHGGHGLK